MRVIGGIHRSRLLQEVPSKATRETKDRVKETIFNSIQFDLPEARVLDLFSGSGSLGIEALSRGALHCDFVDLNITAIRVTTTNLKTLDLIPKASVSHQDAMSYLNTCDTVYDIILLDPPYDLDILSDIIDIIEERRLLAPTGMIVALSKKNHIIEPKQATIYEFKTKTSGITKLSYWKWGEYK